MRFTVWVVHCTLARHCYLSVERRRRCLSLPGGSIRKGEMLLFVIIWNINNKSEDVKRKNNLLVLLFKVKSEIQQVVPGNSLKKYSHRKVQIPNTEETQAI